MKKSISILSFVLLFSSIACRSGDDELGRNTISNLQSEDDKEKEPARKDLQQWRQQP